jgi:hypothetical protein
LLGQTGQSIGIPKLLRFDAHRDELRLHQAEPDGRFLLIVGAKFDLRGCCGRDGLTIVRLRHVVIENERGGSPSNYRELFPGRKKKRRSHCEKTRQRETK